MKSLVQTGADLTEERHCISLMNVISSNDFEGSSNWIFPTLK